MSANWIAERYRPLAKTLNEAGIAVVFKQPDDQRAHGDDFWLYAYYDNAFIDMGYLSLVDDPVATVKREVASFNASRS